MIPSWVYFSSVGEDSLQYHHDIAKWVRDNGNKDRIGKKRKE